MSSLARSRPDAGLDLAVVALSARALARSARRAGLRALSIDLFADADTHEHAALAVRAPASRGGMGFRRAALLDALAQHAPKGLPVVLGAGFEHAPSLMRAIARRNPIVGATPDQVALLKDPFRFSALLSELQILHPPVEATASKESVQLWVSKRIGASGGAHIRDGAAPGVHRYRQRHVDGRPVSALFLANGKDISVVGFSEQWTDPTPRALYRYGGAVGPIALEPAISASISAALARLVAATGLVGLASADMILAEDTFSLLEINPRPGATLDIFDRGDAPSLLALHLDACAGHLPAALLALSSAQAAAIVYADRAVDPASLQRPVWTADWPSCDDNIPAGGPFCTILAAGASPAAARALLERRRNELLTAIRAAPAPAPTNRKKAHS